MVPVFKLWVNNRFQEHVPIVLLEINRMHNYDYLLTVHDANCISQPQSWTLLEEHGLQIQILHGPEETT